ncbi:putative Mg2+ transporter-C (MgtC) family protein [Mucilaginibacter mallensis]|uniref:Putative Mg2+ transporter-C (MgtC) family protein n=1 Tax=Mucilaginibacter mallensis TaxID=652787 RepID=A0A1H1XZ03_MUCMA|nr:MgtC/SapB family protein [Mucilaginibacter mallensis]SDT14301.1 putative Mg2+ transporter-C (MgtC) family protein [Mucilaginibacter mallensis]
MNLNHFWTNANQIIYGNELVKLTLSVIAGSILGLEREIRGKSAGFRTLALICFGATIFTICSYLLGVEDNRDRIAANVITGIGFIGAGVIFRNNSSISGITTAASIWVAAGIGMLLGIGNYLLAGVALIFALFILYALDFIQFWIDYKFQHRSYRVVFRDDCTVDLLDEQVKSLKLKFNKTKILRTDQQTIFEFDIWGKESNLIQFNQWLFDDKSVLSFEW